MCLIVDINIAHRVLFNDADSDFGEVHKRLFTTKHRPLRLVYGGRLLEEYEKSPKILKQIKLLDQAGRAMLIDSATVKQETSRVSSLDLCESDDEHIIALARCSSARLLCSHDQNLHSDFTNPSLVSNPRGKVFQCKKHVRLLNISCSICR